jgi:hypothetical protein
MKVRKIAVGNVWKRESTSIYVRPIKISKDNYE